MEKKFDRARDNEMSDRRDGGSNREDPNRGYRDEERFAQSKRKRIVRVERNVPGIANPESRKEESHQAKTERESPFRREDGFVAPRGTDRRHPKEGGATDEARPGGRAGRQEGFTDGDRPRRQEGYRASEGRYDRPDNRYDRSDRSEGRYDRPGNRYDRSDQGDRPRRQYQKPSSGDFWEGNPGDDRFNRYDGKPGQAPRREQEREGYGKGPGQDDRRQGSGRPAPGGYNARPQGGGNFRDNRGKPRGGQKRGGGQADAADMYKDGNYPSYSRGPVAEEMRLNRYLAISGVSSRREADELIRSGAVTVNGEVVTELGTKVSASDRVVFGGATMRGERKVYILMNKPKGYVTTLDDPHADKTVMDLLKDVVRERVYPVGRLDKNSLGVLLITNDGDMTKRLTHPSYNKKKIYQVTLDKPLTKADMQRLADGIELEDGPIHADRIDYVGESRKDVGVEIHSGRNRIIRRMFSHLGYVVQKLDRVYFAGLTKKKLRRGAWRFLSPKEVDMLHNGMYE